MRAVPRLCGLYPGICLTTEEKARKNLSQDSRRVPATKLQDVKSQSTVILTAVKIRINVKRKKMNCYLLARVIISRKSRQNKVRNYTIRTTMDVGKVVQGGSLPA